MQPDTSVKRAGFGERLAGAVIVRRNPVVVGLDPRIEELPDVLLPEGELTRQQQAGCYAAFCRGVIDVVAPLVPAVKPQAAFFEQLGPPGMLVLADVIEYARQQGLMVILDGKRNDIGTTAAAYADAYLGDDSVWGADALTVSPYLGSDSLEPFVEVARRRSAGVFVLVKTSNPGGGMFQDLVADGRPLYRRVAEHVADLARKTQGPSGYGLAGAVAGATYPDQLRELRSLMPNAWLLVPGYGAQGAGAGDVAGAFDSRGLGAVINSSRAIIFAHRRAEYAGKFAPSAWQHAVEAATRDMIQELHAATPAGKLRPG